MKYHVGQIVQFKKGSLITAGRIEAITKTQYIIGGWYVSKRNII